MGFRGLLLRGAAAVAVAFAAGHLVQLVRPERPMTALPTADAPVAETVSGSTGVPASASLRSGLVTSVPELTGITSVAADVSPSDACPATLQLSPAPGAMINLSLDTPCNPGERIVVRHAGLSFTARTDANGAARLLVPALQAEALVAVYLAGSEVALGSVMVPEANQLRRFAFQWASSEPFTLRVTEGDQVYVSATDGSTHKIMSLGSASVQNPMLAQVYTYPAAAAASVDVSVELRVGPASCGRTLTAQTLVAEWGYVQQSDRPVAVPLCGTSGDILVLKNLAPDLTLATPK